MKGKKKEGMEEGRRRKGICLNRSDGYNTLQLKTDRKDNQTGKLS